MAFQTIPWSRHRQVVYDLLTRAKRFHCSVNATYDFDVTDTLVRLKAARRQGGRASLTGLLVQATAQVLERHPKLNRHLFHGLFGRKRLVEWGHISCTLIVQRRGPDGESILLPLVLRDAHRMSLAAIQEVIDHHRTAALADLPQMAAFERIKRLPGIALRLFSYKVRSDPRFYERYFGTYGLSSLVTLGWGAHSGATLANVAATFLPATIRLEPIVIGGRIEVRRILSLVGVFDHYVVDGGDIVRAVKDLRPLLEAPALDGRVP